MPPTKRLLGVGLFFRLKKKVYFQKWFILVEEFNIIFIAYINILLSFVVLQKLWLEKWLTASSYWAKYEKWRKLYLI